MRKCDELQPVSGALKGLPTWLVEGAFQMQRDREEANVTNRAMDAQKAGGIMKMGAAIRASRMLHNPRMSQAGLARQVGVSRQRLNAIEQGRTRLKTLDSLGRYADALQIPIWRLVQRAQRDWPTILEGVTNLSP